MVAGTVRDAAVRLRREVRSWRTPGGTRHGLDGVIASCGFASGDRVVVGHWWTSPVGPFTDVMWCEPDGVRVLYAPDDTVARFVTALYRFDRLEVVPFETFSSSRLLVVRFGDREVRVDARRRRWPVPLSGSPAVCRWVQGPVARRLMGVRTYGVTGSGVHEWYRARSHRRLRSASATAGGRALGSMTPVEPAVRFGFSEPPRRPSFVRVRPLLVDPVGRLDRVLDTLPPRPPVERGAPGGGALSA
jgi:hypothetical protein